MFEAIVHSELLAFLRQKNYPRWIHHLTMARLLARGLRLSRSTLIQTQVDRQQYYLSYLAPVLLSDQSIILVIPLAIQKQLLKEEIPNLQECLNTNRLITTNIDFNEQSNASFLMLMSPQEWLKKRLKDDNNRLDNIPTIIDVAENLEEEVREHLTINISPQDWYLLQQQFSENKTLIRDTLIKLTSAIFAHPKNPYKIYPLDRKEKELIINLCEHLMINNTIPKKFQNFYNLCQQESQLVYSYRDKKKGQFELYSYPIEIANILTNIWSKQPVFFIGSYLEKDKNAPIFRSSLGINSEEITYLKFSSDAENQLLKLYLPSHLPLPNTPEFTQELIKEILALIGAIYHNNKAIIILINDLPLKSQIAVNIAAQFGSKVQVEPENITTLTNKNILICDWQFWQKNQSDLPLPQLIIIPTLPIPSLENPLVAAKVAYYKSKRENWFHSYLLPTAIKQMQTALISIRKGEGVVALLDNRINYRSYGTNILKSLEPFAKINYFDLTWFS